MLVEIIREGNLSSPQQHMKQLEISHAEDFMSTWSNVNFPGLVEQLKTNSIVDYNIQRVLHLQDFMDAFTERCKNKTVDILAFLWSTSLETGKFIEVEKKMNSLELDLTAQHMDNLIRNLSGFNLEVDKIERDGNCFFRAVASQLNRHLREYKEHIEGHCTSLGLGISEAFDTRRLRELFVKEVSDNIEEYRDWMTTGVNGLEEVYKFSQDGFFANEVGDLCARATAKVLKIPIAIVTALPSTTTVPFLSQEFLTTTPIYIAYDHSGPGHYDATKGTQ